VATTVAADPLIHGQFRRIATAGRGSFGRVLEVMDVHTNEPRALKVVVPGPNEATLLAEFEQLARLHHPSLPRVFEVGRTREAIDDVPAGAPFFVAEWIAGTRSDVAPWQGDTGAVWTLAADLAGALATIHGAGLVHADVAPQNVLLTTERAILVDLGLSGAISDAISARGTPAYMAPEALAGHVDPRSDLYGLGATLYRVIAGHPPFEAASLGELVQRILGERAPRLAGLFGPLADLIARLLARDPDARPASAIAVLDELDQMAPAIVPRPTRRARPAVADAPMPASWPGASAWIDELTDRLERSPVGTIAIVGPPASGARGLVDATLRRLQLEEVAQGHAPRPILAVTLDELARRLGVPAATNSTAAAVAWRPWLERVARAARAAQSILLVELADDPRADDFLAALARTPSDAPAIAIVDRAPRAAVPRLAAPVLDVEGVRALAEAMLNTTPSGAWTEALHAACEGLPLAAIELVRSIADEPEPLAIEWSGRTSEAAITIRTRALQRLPEGALAVATAITAWGGRAATERVLEVARATGWPAGLHDVVALERAGLAQRHRRPGVVDEVAIDHTTARAIEHVAPESVEAAALAIANGEATSADPATLYSALTRVPLDEVRGARACDAAEQLLARGRPDHALALARRALAIAPTRAGLIGARAAAATGSYREVGELARAAAASGADPIEVELVIARACQRAGELDDAEAALARLHAVHPAHAEVAGSFARLLVTRSRYAEARAIARTVSPLAGLAAEAAGLAAFYLGELDDADAAFAALEVGGAAAGDAATAGRALSLRGMVAQQRGQLGLASERYHEAARRLGDVGELHAAAVAELNLGTVLSERGRAAEALPRLAAAVRVFGELGATTELCAAELNHGNALVALGQLDEAAAAADAALTRSAGAPHLRAFALLVAGDARRRRGELAAAVARYREALAIGVERGDAHAQISAHVALAEAGAEGADDPESVAALCASDDDRDRWTIARGRIALAVGDPAAAAGLARACAEVAARAHAADRLERAFRAHAVAARLAQLADDRVFARGEADRARATHATVSAGATAFRAALAADPDLLALPAEPSTPALAAPATGSPKLPLRRLLTLSRRLNSEASVERILDEVIDTAIELTTAERGFLLLRQLDGELAPVVSRNFAAADLAIDPTGPAVARISRSIAERAAQSGEPVVTVDAGIDERFGAAASVAALRLRSVLAVPLRQRGIVTGCIYVDHRLRGGAFDDAAASVLGELADIAAIAIENARLAADLRSRTEQVAELNARLSAELAEKDAELVRVRGDLPDRDRLGHRFERIVGRSPVMVRMLELVERSAATALPVVIVGESGTGKELVARALHDHGSRGQGPFVAVNCSAVPEPLLESELFGHVRGSFTGAERDRRGLFEVADGGTLFLDEIADTSPAMQAKLLRVLQDGMVRRVGETRTRRVDVRVIAASQRSLAELVTAGRFREDLRFRLEVITLSVPPLRDRDGDIPLLVERLLRQICPDRPPPRLTHAAMRALGSHRWPGNVRELENALARGVAMGGDVIDVTDLPEAIAQGAGRPEPARPVLGDDLRLRPALLATEQAYIAAAMARAKNNQTVAARLLGLSRFGLQKKLRRLAGEDVDDGSTPA
jgi:serine/threonine-protein kinase PknK